MEKYLGPVQIVISILLIVLILLQQRGGGLSGIFGGSGEFYGTRRGMERTIFILTVIVAALFITTALLSLIF